VTTDLSDACRELALSFGISPDRCIAVYETGLNSTISDEPPQRSWLSLVRTDGVGNVAGSFQRK
jgi:hypothetical protein